MNEELTRAEIEARFPKEWVLLADPQVDQYQRVLGGKLLWHGKDRDERDQQMMATSYKHIATFYTGPDDGEYIL
jgi:hypothetical protein